MKLTISAHTTAGNRSSEAARTATTTLDPAQNPGLGISGSFQTGQRRLRRTNRATLAMTLVELMVAIAVGSLILTVVAMVFGNGIRSFAAMGNYVSMDRDSRNALDRMTREIRRAGSLTSFAPDRLVFTEYATPGLSLVYQWDGTNQLTEWKTGSTKTNVLLSDCSEFAFGMQKTSGAATTIPSEGKKISVTWKCSRPILGKEFTTEQMQQALIIVRNK